jgi:glucose-1-phosphate thymidylyltransferase
MTLKAVILAAGYAIRLWKSAKGTGYEDLLLTTPKPLLPIAGRLAIDYITDKIREVNPPVDELIVITNDLFHDKFEKWKKTSPSRLNIRIINDQSKDNDHKKGAVRDLAIAVGRDSEVKASRVDSDVFVLSGDRLFEFSLNEMAAFQRARKASILVNYKCHSKNAVKNSGELTVDPENRVVSFTEKPKHPKSTFLCPSIYLFTKSALNKLPQYFKESNPTDPIGKFPGWLYDKVPVYAFHTTGYLLDLGSLNSYLAADKFFRTKLNRI